MSERIVVIVGPSGAGKTKHSAALEKRLNTKKVISGTTRDPRPGEVNGVDYYFFSRVEFVEAARRGEFVENAEVHGHLYGTLRDDLDSMLATGALVLLVVDIQGVESIARIYPEAQTFFITAPKEDLIRRINERDISEEKKQERIAKLDDELLDIHNPFIKHGIRNSDNDDPEDVVQKICDIIVARVGPTALREEA
ncbi:MAG: AAA family ATPase [Candidatus Pacebacteria bacterium]|nr:AAA family ATPase [Candidatus Paceibacterota bacterium]